MKVHHFLLCCAAFLLNCTTASSQNISGIYLGEKLSAVPGKLGSKPTVSNEMGPFSIRKWTLADGNDISVTANRSDGMIVYIETNWGGEQAGAVSDFPGFAYGRTTLHQIRLALGSNGFAYGDRGAFRTPDGGIAGSNSFAFEGAADTVVTFITKVTPKEMRQFNTNDSGLGRVAKLDAIILARPAYLEGLWGKPNKPEPSYRPIRWEKLGTDVSAASGIERFITKDSIIAFTPEPNDLGSPRDFLRKFPVTRCAGEFLDADHLIYFCGNGGGPVQKFYFDFSYGENTVVLVGVSLSGEEQNLGRSLKSLMKLLRKG